MIGAGMLRTRARVMRQDATRDELGRLADTWSGAGQFRCELRDLGGAEQTWGHGASVVRRFELRARWGTLSAIGVTERDRVIVDDRLLRIDSITDQFGRHVVGVLTCSEVSP